MGPWRMARALGLLVSGVHQGLLADGDGLCGHGSHHQTSAGRARRGDEGPRGSQGPGGGQGARKCPAGGWAPAYFSNRNGQGGGFSPNPCGLAEECKQEPLKKAELLSDVWTLAFRL